MFGGGSIQLLRISGIRIGASPSWFIVLFLVIYFLAGYFQDTLGGSQTEGFVVAVCSALLFFASLILHELGHALGCRHKHTRPEAGTCFEDNNWRPLTTYDSASIMHYPQCNGSSDDLSMTSTDASGARALYGS